MAIINLMISSKSIHINTIRLFVNIIWEKNFTLEQARSINMGDAQSLVTASVRNIGLDVANESMQLSICKKKKKES